jgi:hypothetical protein
MDNYRVHFCYLDGVNALIGNYRWRYEVMPREEMYHQIVSLSKRGMTGFRYRRLGAVGPTGEWVHVDADTAKRVVDSFRDRSRIRQAHRRAISGPR